MRAAEAARALRDAGADIVVNTGDYLWGAPPVEDAIEAARPFLRGTRVDVEGPANLAVFGNHDYYAGDVAIRELAEGLRRVGVHVLMNESVCVRRNGSGVSVVGLSGQEPGFNQAIRDLTEVERPRIVLVHEPDVAERLPRGSADLILCGHTHGGQITLPLLTPLIVKRFSKSRYTMGQYVVNGNRLYINRGLGCSGLPFRFRATPELTFLHLVR
jgi:predicted MPP superfamily phosphohydrolase